MSFSDHQLHKPPLMISLGYSPPIKHGLVPDHPSIGNHLKPPAGACQHHAWKAEELVLSGASY